MGDEIWLGVEVFQSPRSGQICSNEVTVAVINEYKPGFNPLDRVKFVQIARRTKRSVQYV